MGATRWAPPMLMISGTGMCRSKSNWGNGSPLCDVVVGVTFFPVEKEEGASCCPPREKKSEERCADVISDLPSLPVADHGPLAL